MRFSEAIRKGEEILPAVRGAYLKQIPAGSLAYRIDGIVQIEERPAEIVGCVLASAVGAVYGKEFLENIMDEGDKIKMPEEAAHHVKLSIYKAIDEIWSNQIPTDILGNVILQFDATGPIRKNHADIATWLERQGY